MRILLVAYQNKGYFVPFIVEQVDALKLLGMEIEYFGVHGKGICGYSREQVNWAINVANCLLMTSHREGSLQVDKEALTCETPIVSVDVGDVKGVTDGNDGCYVTSYDAQKIADNLQLAFAFQGKTKGPQRIVERYLSNELVAKQIIEIYQKVIE